MQRLWLICLLSAAPVWAHLNHVQFAAVDLDEHGRVHIRYRMSADMFLSNLDEEIKRGRINESVKQRPIREILAEYFRGHIRIEAPGSTWTIGDTAFTFDEKNGDWIADLYFVAPLSGSMLFCDAFLENNPRTQTLARFNVRGNQSIFHFRKDSELAPLEPAPVLQTAVLIVGPQEAFVNGLQRGLSAFDWLVAGVLGLLALRFAFKLKTVALIFLGLAAAVILVLMLLRHQSRGFEIGFALAWAAIVITTARIVPLEKLA